MSKTPGARLAEATLLQARHDALVAHYGEAVDNHALDVETLERACRVLARLNTRIAVLTEGLS